MITFDAIGVGATEGASPAVWSHTVTGNNPILFVFTHYPATSAGAAATATYNGVSMTKLQHSDWSGSGARTVECFYLLSPATGAHNVSVSATSNVGGWSVSYDDVSQVAPEANAAIAIASNANYSADITTIAQNAWLVSGFDSASGSSWTAGTNTTIRQQVASDMAIIADNNGVYSNNPGANTIAVNGSAGAVKWLGIIVSFAPANDTTARYWVGGTGTWDATTKTHWSLTSGGSGGASAPFSSTTSIIFDGNSGGGTVTMSANFTGTTTNMTFTGFTGTFAQSTFTLTIGGNFTGGVMTHSGSGANSIAGNLTYVSGMTLSYTGAITMSATSTGKTFTTGGTTILSTITFNGVAGAWTLGDNLTCTGASITLTNGSLSLGNHNVSVPTFVTSNSNTRVLSLGSGTITLTGTGTVWSLATTTGMTLSATTGTIKINDASSSSKTFAGGSLSYYNIYFTGAGTGTFIVSGSNTFNQFKCDTPPHTIQFTAGTTQTLVDFQVTGTAGNLMTLQSTSNGSSWYLIKNSSNQVSTDYLSLQDSHVS